MKGKVFYKNAKEIYGVLGVVMLLLAIYMIFFVTDVRRGESSGACKNYNTGWFYEEADGDYVSIKELPMSLDFIHAGEKLILHNTVSHVSRYSTLAFFTTHQTVKVTVGGQVCYYFGPDAEKNVKTPGNGWNFVSIPRGSEGKSLSISLLSEYESNSGQVPTFYVGTLDGIRNHIISKNLFSLTISCLIFVMGVFVCVCWIFFRKKFGLEEEFICMGIFALTLSVWSALETQIIQIYFGHNYGLSQLSFIALALLSFPFIRFTRLFYELESYRLLDFAGGISLGEGFLILILFLTGIADFKESLFTIHISYAIIVGITVYTVVRIAVKNIKGQRKSALMHICCILFIVLAYIVDVGRYYMVKKQDSAVFGRIAMLLYVLILVIFCFRNSMRLLKAGRESEKIREIAYMDALTKMENRFSFEQRLEGITGEERAKYGVAMFDLNNLKRINDIHGHSAGDYYIIISSEILRDTFGGLGTIYRIGGDEFCAVLEGVSKEEFMEKAAYINEKVRNLKGPYMEEGVGIAKGYALFEKKLDNSLFATMSRADVLMYADKGDAKRK